MYTIGSMHFIALCVWNIIRERKKKNMLRKLIFMHECTSPRTRPRTICFYKLNQINKLNTTTTKIWMPEMREVERNNSCQWLFFFFFNFWCFLSSVIVTAKPIFGSSLLCCHSFVSWHFQFTSCYGCGLGRSAARPDHRGPQLHLCVCLP